jgi:LEA14-like dessication related protein
MMLAQIQSVPSEWLKNFALVIMAIAATAFYIKGIFSSKQKREVSFTEPPASKKEFDAHVEWNRREHENLFSKIGGVERGVTLRIETRLDRMEKESHAAREKLHDRINEVLSAVANLEGRLER